MAETKRQATVALVGGDTLAGREVRDVITTAGLAARLKLIGAEEDAATLTALDGEPVVVSALDEGNLTGADVVILAGSHASSRKAFQLLEKRLPRPAVIDLTGRLQDKAEARLRAPMVEPNGFSVDRDAVQIIAHPASIAMALLLRRIPARRSVVQVLVPASEHGKRGVDELQQQVVSLFSFKPITKEVFDAQVAFNLLSRFGADATVKLEAIAERIDNDLQALMAYSARTAKPSFRLVQAPAFHGYGFSIWLELEGRAFLREVEEALRSPGIEVRGGDEEAPDNVGVAGQSGLIVGGVENDRNCDEAVWLWAVADNLRLAADNAVAVARQLLEARAS